jgi:hypothetical protein
VVPCWYDYDAFGFPYFHSATGAKQEPQLYGNRFLFTGREWLGELRLYDFRNRMYQPELAAFSSPIRSSLRLVTSICIAIATMIRCTADQQLGLKRLFRPGRTGDLAAR